MPSSSAPLALPRLRGFTLLFLGAFALGAFLLSAWGEHTFQGGPATQETLVEVFVESDVEQRLYPEAPWESLNADFVLTAGMSFRTSEEGHLGFLLGGADLLRLFPETEIEILDLDLSERPFYLKVRLVSGSVWVSTLQGVADIAVQTSGSRVDPEYASAFVSYDGDHVRLFAAHHPVRFSFLAPSDDGSDLLVLNDYLLTESHELSVRESTVTDKVAQLLYTKLVKDYPFVYIDSQDWEDDWQTALEEDRDRLRQTYQAFVSFLRRQVDPGYLQGSWMDRVASMVRRVRYGLVFDADYLTTLEQERALELLYESLYLILDRSDAAAIQRLKEFEALMEHFESVDLLQPIFPVLRGVNVTHDFYPVKELLRELQLVATPEVHQLRLSLAFLRERLNEVYDLLDEGQYADAKQSLLLYNAAWQTLMATYGTALVDVVQVLTEERQILQNLLYRESVFYDVEAYAVLRALEDRILTLTVEELDLNEERQAFVKDKITVLKQLIDYINRGKVGLDGGTALGRQLIDEAHDLLQDVTVEVAVVRDFFVPELSELTLIFQFLNAPDYFLGEGTLEQKFEAYLNKQSDLKELSEYLAGLRTSEGESSITLDEALAEVKADFEAIGLSYVALLPLGDLDYRLFKIEEGRLGGIDFEGSYDRGTRIVYDLQVEGETFSSGVKLENLWEALEQAVLEEAMDEEVVVEGLEEDVSAELSPVESVAISLVRRTLESETELNFDEANISIVDFEDNLFGVSFEFESGGLVFEIDFTYEAAENVIFDVVAQTEDRVFEVDDVELSTLKDDILSAWQAAS